MTTISTGRAAGLLAAGILSTAALLAPATIAAAGPGGDDHLPNSGHASNAGGALPTMIANATISCDESDAVQAIAGHFTLDGSAAAGASVVVYLTPNNGSNASPIGNVESNEVIVDISGLSGDVAFVVPVTSGFTATNGGILAVFAKDVDGTVFSSKSNSLNCGESTPLPTPTPAPTETPTETPTEAPTETPKETPTEAPTATPVPTATPPSGTPAPRDGDEPTPTPVATPVPGGTPTPPAATFAAETPQITPPSTDATGASNGASGSGWGLVLIILGALSISSVLLTPAARRVRR